MKRIYYLSTAVAASVSWACTQNNIPTEAETSASISRTTPQRGTPPTGADSLAGRTPDDGGGGGHRGPGGVVLGLPPNVDVKFDPLGGDADPSDALVYERVVVKASGDPQEGLLNAEAVVTNNSNSPVHITGLELEYTDGTGPQTVHYNRAELLMDRDSAERTLVSTSGGWERYGYDVENDSELSGERWNDVAVRTTSGNRAYFAAGNGAQGGAQRFVVARYGVSGGIDVQRTDFTWGSAKANVVRYVGGGKVVVAGGVTGAASYFAIARYNHDLEPDDTFDADGFRHFGIIGCGDEEIVDFQKISDGGQDKYVVVGKATCAGKQRIGIARLLEDGSPDPTFSGNGQASIAYGNPALGVQPAGVVIRNVGGTKSIYIAASMGTDCNSDVTAAGTCRIVITKLAWDGTPDVGFGNFGAWRVISAPAGENHGATSMALDAGGRIYVGGWTEQIVPDTRLFTIVRLNSSGLPDGGWGGFGPGGGLMCPGCGTPDGKISHDLDGFSGVANDLVVMDDGRVAAAGWVETPSGGKDFALVVYDTSGDVEFMKNVFYGTTNAPRRAIAYGLLEDYLGRFVLFGTGRRQHPHFPGFALPSELATARFLSDGHIGARTSLVPGEARRIYLHLPYFVAPLPNSLKVSISFEGSAVPWSQTVPLAEHLNGFWESYPFPAKKTDLPPDTYWSITYAHELGHHVHRFSTGQRYAYDFGAVRYYPEDGGWRSTKPGTDGSNNSDFEIWGLKVYSMGPGEILKCYRSFPDNPAPGEAAEGVGGGGNSFLIRHDNGEIVLYAHLKAGSVPFQRCPIEGDLTAPYPTIGGGDLLGQVGNSGSSSGPHLHVHAVRSLEDPTGFPIRFRDVQVSPRTWPTGPWRDADETALTNGPILIRPFDPANDPPWCDSTGHLVGGPHDGEPCGTLVNAPCADIGADYYSNLWLLGTSDPSDPRMHPNGTYSFQHRCDNDVVSGDSMVCVPNAQNEPVCKRCGEPNPGDSNDEHTMLGCEPVAGCPTGTNMWLDGRCWDENDGLPEWMCEADCEGLYNGYGWCMNGLSWRNVAEDLSFHLASYPWQSASYTYGHPICASTDCGAMGAECASQGLACDPDPGQCVFECIESEDCTSSEPAPAYPNGFVCHNTLTCRLSFEAKP